MFQLYDIFLTCYHYHKTMYLTFTFVNISGFTHHCFGGCLWHLHRCLGKSVFGGSWSVFCWLCWSKHSGIIAGKCKHTPTQVTSGCWCKLSNFKWTTDNCYCFKAIGFCCIIHLSALFILLSKQANVIWWVKNRIQMNQLNY